MQDQPILRVLTMDRRDSDLPLHPPPCTGDPYICECLEHQQERTISILTGPRGAGPAAFAVRTRRAA